MRGEIVLACEFVELIPDELKERTLYVSQKYGTAVHKCCCGCGREVVTPLTPTDWQITINGASVSLYPSIGSWNLPCQSHYWITDSKVIWAPQWTKAQIARGRTAEARAKDRYYSSQAPADKETAPAVTGKPRESLWQTIMRWLFGDPPG